MENPDTFEIIWKIGNHLEKSGLFREHWDSLKGYTCKNFPDVQKLSGQQCYPVTQVFAPLGLQSIHPSNILLITQQSVLIKRSKPSLTIYIGILVSLQTLYVKKQFEQFKQCKQCKQYNQYKQYKQCEQCQQCLARCYLHL